MGRVWRRIVGAAAAVGLLSAGLVGAGANAAPLPIPTPDAPGLVTYATASQYWQAQAILSTPEGYLITLDTVNGALSLFDPASMTEVSQVALGDGDDPTDMALDADGNVWVVTWSGHLWRIERSDQALVSATKVADFPSTKTEFDDNLAPGVAISPQDGSILIALSGKREVYRYSPNGIVPTMARVDAINDYTGQLAVDADGYLYTAQYVYRLDGTDGGPKRVTLNGSSDWAEGYFPRPIAMPNGEVMMLAPTGSSDFETVVWHLGVVGHDGVMDPDAVTVPITVQDPDEGDGMFVTTVGPDGFLYQRFAPTSGDWSLARINPVSGETTLYPFDPAGATDGFAEDRSGPERVVAMTANGLAWMTQTNTGRLALMTIPSSGSAPCNDTATVPVDLPVECTAIVSGNSTMISATYRSLDGTVSRTGPWTPGPDDVGAQYVADLTFTTPGVAVPMHIVSEPFAVEGQTITSITPLLGPDLGGTEITITGTGFKKGMSVFLTNDPSQDIGFEADHVKFVSSTTITAVMPPKLDGWPDKTPLWVGFGWTDPDNPNYLAKSPKPFSYGGPLPPTPVITQVTPDEIAVGTSGQTVTITGSYFTDLMTVSFNGVAATSQTFVSATEMQAVVPPGLPVATGVLVVDPGYSLPVGRAPFTVNGPTSLTSLSPVTGSVIGGEVVTLTGTGFNENTVITIDGRPLPLDAAAPSAPLAQQLSFKVPPHAAGAVDVSVQNPGFPISTLTKAFTYISATVTGISPTSGSNTGGDTLTITGTGLEDVMRVAFRQPGQPEQSAAGLLVDSDTQVRATVPPSAVPGTASVVLVMSDGSTLTAPTSFTYTGIPLPTLTSLSRSGGKVGAATSITVEGSGFMPGALFMLGAAQATAVSVQPGGAEATMEFTIAGPPGVQDLTVTNPGGGATVTLHDAFNAHGPVTISAIDPTTGSTAGGTTVTVTGTGFTADMELNFAGYTGLPYNVTSPTELSFVTKQHAQGFVDLTILNGDLTDSATLPKGYWYQTPTPAALSLTGMSPTSGDPAGGNTVTFTGTGFISGCVPVVGQTGNVVAGSRIVDPRTMTFPMPAGSPGAIDAWVHCFNPSGLDTDSTHLQYTYLGTPQVTSVSPNVGPVSGGTTVIVNGSAFAADLQVSFGGRAAQVKQVAWRGAQATVVVPAGLQAGTVDVVVTNPGQGSASLAGGYAYQQGPTVTSVTPAQGPTAGGTLVVLTGTGFQSGAGVVVKSPADVEAATGVSVRSATSISATLPAFSPGLVDLVVQNPDGTQVVGVDAFTYDDTPTPLNVPTVTSISPNTGAVAGGTQVTILGSDFESDQCLVAFGGVRASAQAYVASTRMTATTPAGLAGAVDVTVTCPTAGVGTLNNGFTYEGAPTLTGIDPGSGSVSGGTSVALTGSGFAANATVFFGANEADSVTVNSATSVTAVTAAGTAGPVDVVLTNPGLGSASLTNAFTFIADPTPTPTVSPSPSPSPTDSPSPSPSPSPTASPTVSPSPSPTDSPSPSPSPSPTASPTVSPSPSPTDSPSPSPSPTDSPSPSPSPTDSPTPAPAPGPAPAPAPAPAPPISTPVIAAVTPFVGRVGGGTTITLTGSGFAQGAVVLVEGVLADGVSVPASTQLTAVTPGGPPGAADVTIVNPDGGRFTFANGFTYEAAPVVSALDVRTGPVVGGTTVTVTGSGFAADATVQFGGAPAQSVRVLNGSTLSAVTPTGKFGWNTVTVTNPGVDSADLPDGFDFEWVLQRPSRQLTLPRSLSADSWTTLMRLPVVSNARQRVKVSVACVPAHACRLHMRDHYLQVKAGGAKQVTVRLTAPAQYQNGYGAFRYENTYREKQIRRSR